MPPLQDASAMFTAPPLLLYMTAEPLEYPAPTGGRPVRLGPPVEPPPWLAQTSQPIVLVTTSSETQDDARLVGCALEALADEDICVTATQRRRSL